MHENFLTVCRRRIQFQSSRGEKKNICLHGKTGINKTRAEAESELPQKPGAEHEEFFTEQGLIKHP